MSTLFRDTTRVEAMTSRVEAPSRIMELTVGNGTFRSGLIPQDSSRLNMQFANSNNVDYMPDQSHKTTVVQSTTFGTRSFGFRSRNLTSHSSAVMPEGSFRMNQDVRSEIVPERSYRTNQDVRSEIVPERSFRMNQDVRSEIVPERSFRMTQDVRSEIIPEGSFRLNQDIRQRNSNISTMSKTFWPAVRNTTLTTGLQMQDRVRMNNDIMDNGVFRRPTLTREIRGRNSTLSSRLFHPQNSDRHYKDLSNINGFNVSHISRRDVDHMSESRLALQTRSNGVDNQSLSGSVFSALSMKAQFMNLLENLHHSILSIGPHITSEAVRLQFDKAKQGLENISEMSFAPSVRPADAASVISQSCKSICAPVNESMVSNTIDGGLLNLKSSKDLLKSLMSGKENYKNKSKYLTHAEGAGEKDEVITSSQNNESDEQDSSLVFKKPRPYAVKRKGAQGLRIKASAAVKNLISKGTAKVVNLTQWYPIAVGSDLAFCGVDEKGASVKTDAVKKRLNNRKVELITGSDCNLIGSPSPTVSALPLKIVALLKNGLTERWKVLQKELLNCQTADEGKKKRQSKSPAAKGSRGRKAEVKTEVKTLAKTVNKVDAGKAKVISSPKKDERKLYTRSGRAVKPPPMFWLVPGGEEGKEDEEKTESLQNEVSLKKSAEKSSEKKSRKSRSLSPSKKPKKMDVESPRKRHIKADVESPSKRIKKANEESPIKKGRKAIEESPSKKSKKADEESPIKRSKKAIEESPIKKSKKAIEESPIKKSKKAIEESPSKKSKKASEESPKKKSKIAEESSNKKTENVDESPSRKVTVSETVGTPVKKKRGRKKKVVSSPIKMQTKAKSPKESKRRGRKKVKKSEEDEKEESQIRHSPAKRKREVAADTDSVQAKKMKNGLTTSPHSPKPKRQKLPQSKSKKETTKKKTVKSVVTKEESINQSGDLEETGNNFDLNLDDIEIPEIGHISGNPQLSRSQLRMVSMETPPLRYFNSNLKLMRSATPVRSPDWFMSQRSESEVKRFQRRREEAFKKKITINTQKTVITEKSKNVQNKDVKKMLEWLDEKTVRSPQWTSKVLQYVIPSRKQMEEQDDEDFEI